MLAVALGGQAASAFAALPDERGWELVSPIEKNGGEIEPPGALMGGGVLQAAANGDSVTYGSAASFGSGSEGAPPASQYIARRNSGGWASENANVPLFSGSYGTEPEGVPYRAFSPDLARGLLLNGRHCRGEAQGCAVANPPLPGTDAPAGYENYYLRTSAGGGFEALLGAGDVAGLSLEPAEFELILAGASPDLRHAVLSTCAALTPDAIEVPLGEGCDPGEPNLYLWSEGADLSLVNVLPSQSLGTPGAVLGAQAGTISTDGSRVYWTDTATGNLYLREGGQTKQVDEDAGAGGTFETATPDGSLAFFTKAGHLWRYDALTESAADLTPSGGVQGVLGASAEGERVYYLAAGLFLWEEGTATEIADGADASNYPPSTGTAHLSADGSLLAFGATEQLTFYDNTESKASACGDPEVAGERCSEVYLYDADADDLTCPSCKLSKGPPLGPSTQPGAIANGAGPTSTIIYKPRALSSGAPPRLFFDSRDNIASGDTNNDWDVYQWEAKGRGDCAKAAGCVALISSGRAQGGASFVDASSTGEDVFFLTDESLVKSDPGSVDLYDARVGGGFPEPEAPIPCEGNACQSLPPAPSDPPLGTTLAGLGNPKVRYSGQRKPCKKKSQIRRGGRCVKRGTGKAKRGGRRRGRSGGAR